MTTNFEVISGATVPKSYFWDIGRPLETAITTVLADSRTEYVSGYAPALKVIFKSDIVLDNLGLNPPPVSGEYIWNFGDYYNTINNEAILDCKDSIVEHTYIMPGRYNVSLTNIQSIEKPPPDTADILCYSKHGIGWFWDNLRCNRTLTKTTWDETACDPPVTALSPKPKWWDDEASCFGKYCKYWNWRETQIIGRNPVFWYMTWPYALFYKRWETEVNEDLCEDELKATIEVKEQTALKTAIVEVLEIKPVASIYNSTTPLTGYSPYTYTLSPKYSKTGSFPIDRIEWSPGDGSSPKIVTRYSTPDNRYFSYNGTYFDDPNDPRNYDFTYTLTRNKHTYPVFYPSLTCYSACTNTSDSCSITVGPIMLEPQPDNLQVLKTKITDKGEVYGIEINKNVTILTSLTGSNHLNASTQIIKPTSPIRQTTKNKELIYFGNTGEGFPPNYVPSCEYTASEYDDYLYFEITESQIPPSGILAIALEDGLLLYK